MLTVTQIKIFPIDYIPYNQLLVSEFIEFVKGKYKFRQHEMPFEFFQKGTPNILIFQGGNLTINDVVISIKKLHFEDRKIFIETLAPSKIAKKVFLSIEKDIKKFDPEKSFKLSDASYITEETSCIAALSVDHFSIFSDNLKSFLNKKLKPFFKQEIYEIRPSRLAYEVDFKQNEELLREHNITLVPKKIIIEPRDGEPLSKNIFYTHSPFNSEQHLKLLKEFEKSFKK